jgi:uncharacterized protein YdeI (YjbR/CyaY-like superfamily)
MPTIMCILFRVKPTFFATPADFRRWLEKHHDSAKELLVGFYKRGSGRPSMTWPESVDQALCFGWIDGIRKRIDDESYTIRFTPRKPKSTWSAVNMRRMEELIKMKLVHASGLRAFGERIPSRSAIYSYEHSTRDFASEYEKRFRANRAAWTFFNDQPPYYRRVAIHWVMTAKKEETRLRRLTTLIRDSAAGRRIAAMVSSRIIASPSS